jgi:uncharacterized protein (TIGR03435 family)
MLLLLQHILLFYAQAAAPHSSFDVLSVKAASPNRPGGRIVVGMTGREGGPGTGDLGRVRYAVICLKYVLFEAYGHKDLRIVGPDWLDDDWFQIDATMPADTTEDQFRAMMQHLLTDRFKLQFHRETKEVAAYSLAVAKNGPKMKETPGVSDPPRDMIRTLADRTEMTVHQTTMERLAGFLASQLGGPVTDATGLTGKYEFTLNFSKPGAAAASDADTPPDVFSAVQSQLGLKLEPKKGTVQLMVIDHIEKKPTEN